MNFTIPKARSTRSLSTAVLLVLLLLFLVFSRLENGTYSPTFGSRAPFDGRDGASGSRSQPEDVEPPEPENPDCPAPPVHHLLSKKLGLSNSITYSKRCIKPVASSSVDRDAVVNISSSMFEAQTEIDLTSCEPVELPRCDPLPLRVPGPDPKATYPHLLFGVATSYDRFEESIDPFAFWLGGTRAKLVGVVTDAYKDDKDGKDGKDGKDLRALVARFADAGIDAKFYKPKQASLSVSQNHFTMIREMVDESQPETQWLGLLDDDTFFPSLRKLSDTLGEIDHTQPVYAGALSEDFRAVRTFGYMAFGGAGVFLSSPLARDLASRIDQCLEDARTDQGDGLLRDCVYRHTKVKLTMVPGLQQMDMGGDATGYYEGGPSPISLHHWKSWYQSPVAEMSTVTRVCGDCFLQRWRFGEDTVLTNGYSIAVYRDGLTHLDLESMEGTWSGADTNSYEFSIGPARPQMSSEEKKDYKLVDAHFLEDGRLRQIYVYREEKLKANDEVIELVWEPSKAGVLRSKPF